MHTNNQKVKILMLAPTRVVGGITTWLRFLLKYSNTELIDYEIIDTSKLYEPLGKKFGLSSFIWGGRDAFVRFYALISKLTKQKPDLVYLTCAPSLGFVFRDTLYLFLLWILGIPSVAHLHGGNVDGFIGGNLIRRILVRSALRTCRSVIVITREIERACIDVFGSEKVAYMPNMYDDDLFACHLPKEIKSPAANEPFKLLHVAWQSREKGTLDLIEAVSYIKSNVNCSLVGTASTDFLVEMNELINEMKVVDKVLVTGQKTGDDLKQLFDGADLFILPTHLEGPEGFPMVILEAMAYGIPIIANEVGNIREMIGVDDLLPAGVLLTWVDPVDPHELAKIIDELISDYDLRCAMSRAGRERIENKYLASEVVPILETHIKGIIS